MKITKEDLAPTLHLRISRPVADNEVYLSFVCDAASQLFEQWLQEEGGYAAFEKWALKQNHDK